MFNLKIFTKKEIIQYKDELLFEIRSGEISALRVLATIKFYKYLIEGDEKKNNGLADLVKPIALAEFYKQPEKSFDKYGLTFQESEVGIKLDYSHDSNWKYLQDRIDLLIEQRKEREEFLKKVPAPDFLKGISAQQELDKPTGELIDIFPPVKTSTTMIKTSFKS